MNVCKYCLVTKGLGPGINTESFDTDEKFAEHIESEHNICVIRENETSEQAKIRFDAKYPDAKDLNKCKCPGCMAKRGDFRHRMVDAINKVVK